jgi:site-specific DNA-methyltransferase (adenine-specific)
MVVRRRPGQVRDAIVAYLAHMQDASVAEIQEAVNTALGGAVPASSVRSYLRSNVGDLFERTARGRYRLVGQP